MWGIVHLQITPVNGFYFCHGFLGLIAGSEEEDGCGSRSLFSAGSF